MYLAAVVWATRPPPPIYVSGEKTVVDVTDTGMPSLLHSPPPVYPEAALRARVEGSVKVHVTIDENGGVSKAEAVAGPELLREAAVEAVRGWQFSAFAGESQIDISFLLWHAGPRKVQPAEVVTRVPAVTVRGRHGKVRLVATIGENGTVESAKAVTGPRRLHTAAVDNVRMWLFRPELHDGKPARATTVVEVVF
jgi:TonB family protein